MTIYLYELPDAPLDSVAVTGSTRRYRANAGHKRGGRCRHRQRIKWIRLFPACFCRPHGLYRECDFTGSGGYDFTAATTATLNGEPVTPVLNGDGTLTVSYTFAKTGAAPVVTYERVTSFTPGRRMSSYQIKPEQQELCKILSRTRIIWRCRGDGQRRHHHKRCNSRYALDRRIGHIGICLVNDNKYLARGSSSNYLVAGDKPSNSYGDWFYNSNKQLYITSSGSGNNYYLYWSSQNYFRANSSAQSDESFYLYKQTITVPELESIEAAFTQDGMIVYTTTNLDDLKANLIVTARYDDGSTILLSDGDYTLSGTLAAGESTVESPSAKNSGIHRNGDRPSLHCPYCKLFSGGSLYAGKP